MFLLCGLGNKGSEYQLTRHNIGYLVIDRYSEKFGIRVRRRESGCITGLSDGLLLAKPNTYMNLSGGPVSKLIRDKGIRLQEVLVVHDDIDMEFGRIRIRWDGSDGGHKGARSLIEHIGTNQFWRMKIGVGRHPCLPVEEYVLSGFDASELKDLSDILDRAVDAVRVFVYEGREKAMSLYNRNTEL